MKGKTLFLFLALILPTLSFADNTSIDTIELDYPATLPIIHRAQWGWQPLQREISRHEIKRITIHHGGVEFPDDRDPLEHLRALQNWSRSDKDWIDIPYHFMIDRQGRIYETRPIDFPGDTNTEYDPVGHALVEVMGNYELQVLSEEQLNSMVAVIEFLAETFGVPVEEIRGHRDYADTSCPGEDVYRYLLDGTIRARVRDALKNVP